MRRTTRRIGGIAVSMVVVFATYAVAVPGPAFAFAAFQYGRNYPNGTAAVDYIYGPDGMWKQLSNVDYTWNYYEACAPDDHRFDKGRLEEEAKTMNRTALDADHHLLLDLDHNGEIDVRNAGFAFHEHNAREAGNVKVGDPFLQFWFDDNWLARYMAQAYNRPLPDGLSDYGPPTTDDEQSCVEEVRTRWRILGGDTRWTPYGDQDFDRLALDGLYLLALGQVSNAWTKWTQIRDRSAYYFDPHTGVYVYEAFRENYHIALFKILTEQLIASGQVSSTRLRELLQHSVYLRSALIEHQQSNGSTLFGWTSGHPAEHHKMNTESIATSVLALGAGAKATFEAGEAPLLSQPNSGYYRSEQGILFALAGFARPGHMTYGPYFTYPAGSYTVDFLLRSANPTGTVAHLDVYDAQSGRVLGERSVTASMLGTTYQWVRVSVPITVSTPANSLEFRTWWYGNSNLDVAEIRLR